MYNNFPRKRKKNNNFLKIQKKKKYSEILNGNMINLNNISSKKIHFSGEKQKEERKTE